MWTLRVKVTNEVDEVTSLDREDVIQTRLPDNESIALKILSEDYI